MTAAFGGAGATCAGKPKGSVFTAVCASAETKCRPVTYLTERSDCTIACGRAVREEAWSF
jgi:hypothetical protein